MDFKIQYVIVYKKCSDSLEQRRFGRRTKCIIIAAVDAVAKRGSVGEGG